MRASLGTFEFVEYRVLGVLAGAEIFRRCPLGFRKGSCSRDAVDVHSEVEEALLSCHIPQDLKPDSLEAAEHLEEWMRACYLPEDTTIF